MPWARVSAAERWLVCPASTVLPQDERPPGASALWGTDVHHWAATGVVPDSGNGWAHLIQQRVDRHPGLRERLWPAGEGRHELSFAIGPDGRVRHTFHHPDQATREKWKAQQDPDVVTGTADWVGDILGEVWIEDLKTGKFPQPPTIPQLRVETVLAPDGWPATTSVLHWPRYPTAAPPVRTLHGWTHGEVEQTRRDIQDAHSGHLEAANDLSAGRAIRAVTGDHCRWCPSQRHCETYNDTALRAVSTIPDPLELP